MQARRMRMLLAKAGSTREEQINVFDKNVPQQTTAFPVLCNNKELPLMASESYE